ncbi:retrovirus-related pol polyprotein from transposon TNT 1-94 [Tanacetum coccineum]
MSSNNTRWRSDPGTSSEDRRHAEIFGSHAKYKNDNQTGQFGNQRAVNVAGARDTVGGQVVQQSGIQCFNCKEFGHFAKECRKPKQNVMMSVLHLLIFANLKLDVDENKKIQKKLKKANATLTQELTECKSVLTETSRTLGESKSIRDSCLVALQNKQTELEEYMAFNNRTVDYEKLERKLNETLRLLAQKDIDIKEGLKVKAYEISVVQAKHDELVKQSLLTKSHYEGLVKEKTKVIMDLKLKEEKDIDKMISMEKQLTFLNEILYNRNQSIQTIHMLAPKCPTFSGRPTFANPVYLKKAQYEKPSQDMQILTKTCLMPLALKDHTDSFAFVLTLKHEMHADLKYVESLEDEIDELESDKAEFLNMYDMLLQECVSNDVMCS